MQMWAIIRGVVTVLVLGVVLDVAFSISWWKYWNITDGPWWVGFLIFGFCYLCALPGLLIPYVFFAVKRVRSAPRMVRGCISGAVAGLFYPASVAALTGLGWWAFGADMAWDRLVEHVGGWVILAAITLGPGIVLSWVSLRIEDAWCEGKE